VAGALLSNQAARDMLIGRYRVPQPRNALARAVLQYADAAMDVSDGLAGDAAKLCTASGVSALINAASVPLSAPATELVARHVVEIETLLSGGDDYEILCAVPETHSHAFIAAGQAAGVAITPIGTILAQSDVEQGSCRFVDEQGRELALKRLSYSHF